MLQRMLLLAGAGALGTLARYGLGGLVQRLAGGSFPWGTVVVNIAGCLLAGLVWSLAERRMPLDPVARLAIFVGFMGAFTTFSAFALETSHLLRHSGWSWALGNILLQNTIGLLAMSVGLTIGRYL